MPSIANKLQVLPGRGGGLIVVPGTEAMSSVSSTVMMSEMQDAGVLSPSLVTVEDALANLPGSQLILMDNFGGVLQKVFVLPESDVNCPCDSNTDWYDILRGLASEPTDEDLLAIEQCASLDGYDRLYG